MKINNETLKKLTNTEAQNLDLFSIGCMFVRGDAKQRTKNWKNVLKSEDEMHYVNGYHRVELIKLDSKSIVFDEEKQDWCVRVYNMKFEEYERDVQPLFAINFVK